MQSIETKHIQIAVNGEDRSVPEGSNLLEVLSHLKIQSDRVAIEKDRAIVRKGDWEATIVQPGAQLEIVQFVGGG